MSGVLSLGTAYCERVAMARASAPAPRYTIQVNYLESLMRRVMVSKFVRSGPRFVLSENGFFKELSTGNDGSHEHNFPESHLSQLLSAVSRKGGEPTEHELFESLRITQSENVQFHELGADEQNRPQAVLGYFKKRSYPGVIVEEPSVASEEFLNKLKFRDYDEQDIVSALAYGDFAVMVRGEQLVRALKHFYKAVQAGTVYLAPGSRLKSQYGWSSGLTMVDMAVLSEEERQQMPSHVVETVRRQQRMSW